MIEIGFDQMKNIATHPMNSTFSHQCITSTKPSVGPLISVVTPRTISWCAWCDMEISKGDLRSLIVSTNKKPKNASHAVVIAGASRKKTPATSNHPDAMKNATHIR